MLANLDLSCLLACLLACQRLCAESVSNVDFDFDLDIMSNMTSINCIAKYCRKDDRARHRIVIGTENLLMLTSSTNRGFGFDISSPDEFALRASFEMVLYFSPPAGGRYLRTRRGNVKKHGCFR